MINSINDTNNISFSARYLKINKPENFPDKIHDAICKSEAIDTFLKEGTPKSLIGKILDFFKADEILDVYYRTQKTSKFDKFAQNDTVTFEFGKKNKKYRFLTLGNVQNGIRRRAGSVPKAGEDLLFVAPKETSEDILAKAIEDIKDFDKMLTNK